MNVIYFNTHDSGRYFSPYGYKVPTPHIEEFSRESILFRNAFCAAPTCSPSRGSLLSGMYPHTNGLIGLSHRGHELKDYNKHLGAYLKEHGYKTAIAGTEHIANRTFFKQHELNYDVLPYDTIIGLPEEDNDVVNAKKVATYIKEFDTNEDNFFISFGLWSTHRKYPENITEGYEPEYVHVPSTMKDTPENRVDFAHYCTSVKIADTCFKIVMEALKEKDIYDDTLVILTTDHGLASPFMKASLTDAGIGVALMLHVPGMDGEGRVIDAMVSHVDLFPTVCDLLAFEKPDYLQGLSQMKVLTGEEESIRDTICAETNYHASFEPMRCIRTKDYKYVRVLHDYQKPMLANIDDSAPKMGLIEVGFANHKVEEEYLYDLTIDPNERTNFINDLRYMDIKKKLSNGLDQFLMDTEDLKIDEDYEHPNGIVLNPPEAINPKDRAEIVKSDS